MSPAAEILQHLSQAILVLDDDFNVAYLNQAAESLCDHSSEYGVGRSVFELIDAPDIAPAILQRCLREYQATTVRETSLTITATRELHQANCHIAPLSNTELLIEVELIDRILQISKQDQMRTAQNASRHLVRSLAHEIKNPLGGIRGAAQLLRKQLPENGMYEYTDIIIEETDRLGSLVDRMLGPRQRNGFDEVNIHEIINRVKRLVEVDDTHNVTFTHSFDPSIPNVKGDFDQLIQALLNIVKNAMEATLETENPIIGFKTRIERQFTIGATRHPMVVHIIVSDNGSGVPEEIQDQIFYPLITNKASGSGIGLAITQTIVGLHHGIVVCDEDHGWTRFHIYLPVCPTNSGGRAPTA